MDMQQASSQVLAKLGPTDTTQINPAIIAIIIEMISTLLPMLLEQCNKKASEVPLIADKALKMDGFEGMIYRWSARRACIRELGRSVFLQADGDVLLKCVLEVGAATKPVEIEQLYASMNVYRGE